MAKTKDYLDYLTSEVGIAPANSQEELDCAQGIAEMFESHGLRAEVQEFSAPGLGTMARGIAMVLAFLGVVLSGTGGAASVVGIALAVVMVGLLAATRMGTDVLSKVGPAAHSQNVIAMHAASGPKASRSNRPIVIVAHYDTQRLDLLSRPPLAQLKRYLYLAGPYCVAAAGVCALFQALVFLPEPFRGALWVIGIVASLPVLLWGVALVAGRFLPYAEGAVDNKSSVAAMLGVLEDVRPEADSSRTGHATEPDAQAEPAEEPVRNSLVQPASRPEPPTVRQVVEQVVGARHGERVLRDLQILPASCEITYIEPEVRTIPVAEPVPEGTVETRPASTGVAEATGMPTAELPRDEVEESLVAAPAPEPTEVRPEVDDPCATSEMERVGTGARLFADLKRAARKVRAVAGEAAADLAARASSAAQSHEVERVETVAEAEAKLGTGPGESAASAGSVPAADPGATTQVPPVAAGPGSDVEGGGANKTTEAISVAERLSQLEDGESTDEGPLVETDRAGLDTMAESAESDETAALEMKSSRPVPAAVDDADWGKSTFAPRRPVASVARRAALFDLPDPSMATQDGLEPTPAPATPARPQPPVVPEPVRIAGDEAIPVRATHAAVPAPSDDIQVLHAPADAGHGEGRRHQRFQLFGKKDKREQSMSDWLGVDEGYDAKTNGCEIGSWDNFDADEPTDGPSGPGHWKGGAARSAEGRERLEREAAERAAIEREIDSDAAADYECEEQRAVADADDRTALPNDATPAEPAPDGDADLRDAILAMADDDLVAHDIWFVATGASSLGHAGMKAFVEEHRRDLRGAFIINLECVGAGVPTLLTREGFGKNRRADRRVVRLLSSVASDLHVELPQRARAWADTEVTCAQRRSMRAVTIMGLDEFDLPACSRTDADISENVDKSQIADINAVISEAIRRS